MSTACLSYYLYWPTGYRLAVPMTLAVPQRAKREVKKTEKSGGSNKCQEWEK